MSDAKNKILSVFRSPGTLLVLVTLFSLILANSGIGVAYRNFWHFEAGFHFRQIALHKSILHWVNDGLMCIFFFSVGLEIRRELHEGELSTRRKAMLPVVAAIGGMIFPALIFLLFNFSKDAVAGWGVPMATDIAFALAVLSMLKSAVPAAVRIFLTALAIIDDLGAILVIAFFYTADIAHQYLIFAAGVVFMLFMLNRIKVFSWLPYIVLGLMLWYFVLMSGIHATIAGVVLAFFIPMHHNHATSMLHRLEHSLSPVVSFFILPAFAIANTALEINISLLGRLVTLPALGIFFGLVIGKPLGITLFSYLSVRLKMAELPKKISINHIAGAGMLGGIGFTMSIFIAMLAFKDPQLQDLAKVTILMASCTAALTGMRYLKKIGKMKKL
jgi:Na+:H+ antiporter, NhaA family